MSEFEKLFTAREIALVFGLRSATIYRWAKQGLLPCVKVGRVVRFRRSDIENMLFEPNAQLKRMEVVA